MIKRTIIILILLFIVTCSDKHVRVYGTNTKENGTNLFDEPNANGKQIGNIKYQERIIILDENGPQETLYGLKAKWLKVEFDGKKGWVFGGFIVKDEPTDTDSQPSSDGKWSAFQGRLKWEDAKAKCESIGMRLPSIDELKEACKSGVTKSWEKNGLYYWSSSHIGEFTFTHDIQKDRSIYLSRDTTDYVRCTR